MTDDNLEELRSMTAGREGPRTYTLPRRVHIRPQVTIPAALALALFLLGPRVQVDEVVSPSDPTGDLDTWLAEAEQAVPGVRPGDGKGVVWLDPAQRARTPVAVVYLHGFSADRHEIDPVPQRVAHALGANLFFTRLKGHGRDGAAMGEASAGDWLQDVEEALTIGTRLGEKIVVLGTSTGGTLAVWAALQERWADQLMGLALVSPNFQPSDRNARFLLLPWANVIARAVLGPERCFEPANPGQRSHWTTCYPSKALLPMMALVERVRTMDLSAATVPALVLYNPGDRTVDAAETERYYQEYGGAPKSLLAIDGVRDPDLHVLAGDLMSPDTNDRVTQAIVDFLQPLAPPAAASR